MRQSFLFFPVALPVDMVVTTSRFLLLPRLVLLLLLLLGLICFDSVTSLSTGTTTTSSWFPTKIQQDTTMMEYQKVIQSMYLRHIVLERMDTAQLVLQQLLQWQDITTTIDNANNNNNNNNNNNTTPIISNNVSRDPFGTLAQQVSACSSTRQEGGRIGWVDWKHPEQEKEQQQQQHDDDAGTDIMNNNNINNNSKNNNINNNGDSMTLSPWVLLDILPKDVLLALQEQKPKPGDIHVLKSQFTRQVHILKVEEVYFQKLTIPKRQSFNNDDNNNNNDNRMSTTPMVGAHSGINAMVPRPKLKGQGIVPHVPSFHRRSRRSSSRSSSSSNSNSNRHQRDIEYDDGDDQEDDNILSTYTIQTNVSTGQSRT
jgi:hypothetical protein